MKFYKFALFKRYFDIGYGISSWFKYLVVLIGMDAVMKRVPTYWLVIGAFVYFFLCMGIGFFWLKSGIYEAEQEVANVYNLFVKQMRKKIKAKSI